MADRLFMALVWVNYLARVCAGGSEVSLQYWRSHGARGNARSAIIPVTATTAPRVARGNARSAINPVSATGLLAWGHLVPLGHAVATPVGAACCPHDCCAQRLTLSTELQVLGQLVRGAPLQTVEVCLPCCLLLLLNRPVRKRLGPPLGQLREFYAPPTI